MLKIYTFLLCLLCTWYAGIAQTSTLQGKITESGTGGGLIGVNIVLKGRVHGTVSGLHGDYILKEIPAGKQTIIFTYLGYESNEFVFEFRKSESIHFDLEMIPGSIDLSTVTVEARQPPIIRIKTL